MPRICSASSGSTTLAPITRTLASLWAREISAVNNSWQSPARIPTDLVAGDLLPGPAAADHDRAVRMSVEDPATCVLAERRVVHELLADVRGPVVDLVPLSLQPADQPHLQRRAVVVRCQGDPRPCRIFGHMVIPYRSSRRVDTAPVLCVGVIARIGDSRAGCAGRGRREGRLDPAGRIDCHDSERPICDTPRQTPAGSETPAGQDTNFLPRHWPGL